MFSVGSNSFLSICSCQCANVPTISRRAVELLLPSGDGEIRTHDPLLARQVLSQLSYTPIKPEIREANFVLELRFKKRAMLQRMFFRSESSHKKSEAFLRSFS